jgi:ABC-type glycerol-3-phosphate transport system substrate-binding protein
MMKKTCVLILLFLLSAGMIFGGGQDEGATTEQVELHFYSWAGWTDLVTKIADDWMELHPEVTVIVDEFNYLPYLETINNMVLSGEGGDLMLTLGGSWHIPLLVDNGGLLDLTPYYEKYDWESQLHSANKITEYSGQFPYVTIVLHVAPVIYYNVDLFNRLGLEYPENEEELYEVVSVLNDNGYEGIALGALNPNFTDIFMSGVLPRYMTTDDYNEMITTAHMPGYDGVKFTDPEVLRAYETLKRWIDDGIFTTAVAGTDDDSARALFLNEEAGMLAGASWTTGRFQSTPPSFNYDVALIPQLDENIPMSAPLVTNNGLTIKADTKYADEAAAFLDFYINRENQIYALQEFGHVPARTDIPISEIRAYISPAKARIIELTDEYHRKQQTTEMMLTTLHKGIIDPYLERLTEMINGVITPEELVQYLEDLAEDARAGIL